MDDPPLPSAADLGVTEVEYERIMRGLKQREDAGLRPPADARDLVETNGRITYAGPPARIEDPAPARPRRKTPWKRLALAAFLALVAATLRHSTSSAGGPAYKFLDTISGHPVTQSSCKQLRVEIYPAGGPSDAESVVREAVGILRSATGLDIVVTGVFGGHSPGWNFQSAPMLPDDPVGVSWQDGSAIAELTEDVAGLGGSRIDTSARGTQYLVSGTIALSRDYFAHEDHAHQVAVVLHEFGHVLGLDHVDSTDEIMNPFVHATTLGPGDRQGLQLAGKGPCV